MNKSKKGYMGKFGRRGEKWCNYIIISKIKKKHLKKLTTAECPFQRGLQLRVGQPAWPEQCMDLGPGRWLKSSINEGVWILRKT